MLKVQSSPKNLINFVQAFFRLGQVPRQAPRQPRKTPRSKMSIQVPLTSLTATQKKLIRHELVFKEDDKQRFTSTISAFVIIEELKLAKLPFAFALNSLQIEDDRTLSPPLNMCFNGVLRPEQSKVKDEIIELLHTNCSAICSCYTGFGKSITALSIACSINSYTLIVVNKIVLFEQWKQSVEKYTSSECTILTPKIIKKLYDNSELTHFSVVNLCNIHKLPHGILRRFEFVICDEIHLLCSKEGFKAFFNLEPVYLLGLSATPYRHNNLDKLIRLFFGTHVVVREQVRPHEVFMINTHLTLKYKMQYNGKPDWSDLITAQSEHPVRNAFILNLIQDLVKRQRTILVVVKRVKQAEYFVDELARNNIQAGDLFKSNHDHYNSQVVIAILSNVGAGFDYPDLDTIILAADTLAYTLQTVGRVMRKPDTVPIIYDIVDNQFSLLKHFKERKQVYLRQGGTITCTTMDRF